MTSAIAAELAAAAAQAHAGRRTHVAPRLKYQLQVMEYLQKMARSDMTVIVAEHDISLMARYCDVCVIMKKGEIVAVGDPKEIITEDLIRDVYDVEARVGLDVDGEIYMLPKRYVEGSL